MGHETDEVMAVVVTDSGVNAQLLEALIGYADPDHCEGIDGARDHI